MQSKGSKSKLEKGRTSSNLRKAAPHVVAKELERKIQSCDDRIKEVRDERAVYLRMLRAIERELRKQ